MVDIEFEQAFQLLQQNNWDESVSPKQPFFNQSKRPLLSSLSRLQEEEEGACEGTKKTP